MKVYVSLSLKSNCTARRATSICVTFSSPLKLRSNFCPLEMSLPGKNLLRYLNHSSKPHAEFIGFELFAIRDINLDEEITIDYGEAP